MNSVARRWADRLARLERHYFAVDGGSGAALLAELAGTDDRVRPADSPQNADVLLIIEPISERLLDALVETYRSMGGQRHVVVVGPVAHEQYGPGAPLARLEALFPGLIRVADATLESPVQSRTASLVSAIRNASGAPPHSHSGLAPAEILIPLRTAAEKEIATEDVVLSIGPIQTCTAGPVRILLTMDGEQVVRAEVRSGYAARGLERLARERHWNTGPALAAMLDPLAPVAGRTAFAQAIEALAGLDPPLRARQLREIALRRERAANYLVWTVGFAELLGYASLARSARQVARSCGSLRIPSNAVVPGGWDTRCLGDAAAVSIPAALPEEIRRLARHLQKDRLLALRTRGVGFLSADDARQTGTSGPVRVASEESDGDAWARTLVRLFSAADDLQRAAELDAHLPTGDERHPWPPGSPLSGAAESEILGPRGQVTLQLQGDGGDRPAGVQWARPSAVHLGLIPMLASGHTLPDAMVAIASLDLSMPEADG